jgi:polar amino acid transport system substrate-binding protein
MQRASQRRRALLAVVFVPLLLAAACGDDDTTETGEATTGGTTTGDDAAAGEGELAAPGNLVQDGSVTICSDTPYEPFQFREDGEDTGYDIDLIREIASRAGLDIEVIDLPFEGILGSLAAGQCDLVASAVTITDERAEQVDFSDPYFDADQSLLVKANRADELSSLDDLAGGAVGVQTGTTGAEYAEENAPDGASVQFFEDSDALFAAIDGDAIDAILQDLPVNAWRATQEGTLEVVESYSTGEQYGFAVAQANDEVLELVNTGLEQVREDGTFDEIYAEYFGEAP